MATSTVYIRGSIFGRNSSDSPFESLDPEGELTAEQFDRLESIFKAKVDKMIEEWDPTLTWYPDLSEVWCDYDETTSDPDEFLDWWKHEADFDSAINEAWDELSLDDESPTTYRDLMAEEGGNLGWCVPYISDDGTVALTINEGKLNGITVDGKEAYLPADCEALLHDAVLRLVSDPSDYEGYTDLEILTQHDYVHVGECRDCPWFDRCDAMDDKVEI